MKWTYRIQTPAVFEADPDGGRPYVGWFDTWEAARDALARRLDAVEAVIDATRADPRSGCDALDLAQRVLDALNG